jgi:hypothetical protein
MQSLAISARNLGVDDHKRPVTITINLSSTVIRSSAEKAQDLPKLLIPGNMAFFDFDSSTITSSKENRKEDSGNQLLENYHTMFTLTRPVSRHYVAHD